MNTNKKTIRLTENKLREIVAETIRKVLQESALPTYEQPIFLDCTSKDDADFSIEIGYSDYSSSLFYVGCVYDAYDAVSRIIRYLKKIGILDNYAADEEEYNEFPDDYIEVDGIPFRRDMIVIHEI